MKPKKIWIFLAIPLAVGGLATLLSGGMGTYQAVAQPPLSPPGWIFPIVWTLLYLAMGYASYRVYSRGGDAGTVRLSLILYGVQLFFNFLWPIAMRTLDDNVHNARQVVRDLWEERRNTILTEDALYQWFLAAEETINASGAYLRETEKWRGGAVPLDLGALSAFMIDHMNAIERILYDTWPLDIPAIYRDGE